MWMLGAQPMLCGHLGNTSKLYIYVYISLSFPAGIFPLLNFLLTGWISFPHLRYTLKHCHRSFLHHQKRVCSPCPPGNGSFYLNLSSGLGSWRGGKGAIKNRSTSYFHRLLLIFLSHLRIFVESSFLPGWKKKKWKRKRGEGGKRQKQKQQKNPKPQTTRTHAPASSRLGAQSGREHCTISSLLVRSTAHFPPGFAQRYRLTRERAGAGGAAPHLVFRAPGRAAALAPGGPAGRCAASGCALGCALALRWGGGGRNK